MRICVGQGASTIATFLWSRSWRHTPFLICTFSSNLIWFNFFRSHIQYIDWTVGKRKADLSDYPLLLLYCTHAWMSKVSLLPCLVLIYVNLEDIWSKTVKRSVSKWRNLSLLFYLFILFIPLVYFDACCQVKFKVEKLKVELKGFES